MDSVIVKRVSAPASQSKNRDGQMGHRRKKRSYEVEANWYGSWASRCDALCRVPRRVGAWASGDERTILLEDLDAAGFPRRKSRLDKNGIRVCLKWLAHFHARFLGAAPEGLWKSGTYWHLATRPDELAAMPNGPLKTAASALDERLNCCRYKTIVHGDAKVENFCFSYDGRQVAAVDFQYVGGGCGIKDVAYLMDSALSERDCSNWEGELLECYFNALNEALLANGSSENFAELRDEWSALYPVAWADFYRFLAGWSPQYAQLGGYRQRLIERGIALVGP